MHMQFYKKINPICGMQAKQVVQPYYWQQGVFILRRQQLKQRNIFFFFVV